MRHVRCSIARYLVPSILFVFVTMLTATPTHAAGVWPQQIYGYAWSSNIGWISFNSANPGSGGGSYAVAIQAPTPANPTWGTGYSNLTGYAWSSTVGWIQFGGGLGCPPDVILKDQNCNARINFATNELQGWARAIAGTDPATNGGWDGWISLNCDNTGTGSSGDCGASSYRVSVYSHNTTAGFDSNSYAWGSFVVGWISFSLNIFTPPCPATTACLAGNVGIQTNNAWCQSKTNMCATGTSCSTVSGTPTCVATTTVGSLTVTPQLVHSGGIVQVQWNAPGASACYVLQDKNNIGSGSDSGTIASQPISNHTTTFSLYCTNGGVDSLVDTKQVRLMPTIYEN